MADLEKLVEQLSELSVLEAAELVKALEEKMGRFRCRSCCRYGRRCPRRSRSC